MPPIFSAFALSVSCIVVASLVLFALLLFFVGCGCVVGGSFSLRMIATKRKGKLLRLSSLRGLWLVLYV